MIKCACFKNKEKNVQCTYKALRNSKFCGVHKNCKNLYTESNNQGVVASSSKSTQPMNTVKRTGTGVIRSGNTKLAEKYRQPIILEKLHNLVNRVSPLDTKSSPPIILKDKPITKLERPPQTRVHINVKTKKVEADKIGYGIIIHYGLYSYYGYDDLVSAKRRKTKNGSEWYYGRLIDTSTYRPISGGKATQQYHKDNYGDASYFDNIDKITHDENKVKEWVTLAKINGASFIILTSKHHDGVCLFDTKTTHLKSRMDICRVFSEECKKQNILFGFYYSWFEFGAPFTVPYFRNFCIPQLEELMKYNPNYMWFDGDWKITQKTVESQIKDIVKVMKSKNIIVNDRIGKNNTDLSSYRVFSDRFIPDQKLENWQHINTIGYSWGYNKTQEHEDYKTKKDLSDLYKKVTNLGGTFLINLGPDENAQIVPEESNALEFMRS
jgi:alpha-L-fucosidase